MKKILFIFCLLFSSKTNAQMAVIDVNGLTESIKSNATMASILETGKRALDTGKEALNYTKEITDTVGSAYSLALTAQSFILNSGQLLQCVVPDLKFSNMSFEITDICSAQDYIREALDMPTSTDIQEGANVIGNFSGGNMSWRNLNQQTKKVWQKIQNQRKTVHKKSVDDGLATALAVKADSQKMLMAARELVLESNKASTVMQKVSITNKGLADIHALLVQQTIILANILQVISSKEKLNEPTLINDDSLTTTGEK